MILNDAGLTGKWSFNGDANDCLGLNNLTGTNVAYVTSQNGQALDLQTAGYATKTGITSGMKTSAGTLDTVLCRTDTTKYAYISFSSNGSFNDEIIFFLRPSNDATWPQTAQISVYDGGVGKIAWLTANNSITFGNNVYFRVTLTADGSGTSTTGYRIYINGSELSFATKSTDTSGYRGVWSSATALSSIDSFTVGGVWRATIAGNVGYSKFDWVRLYDYVKTPEQIALEQKRMAGGLL